MNYIEPQKQLRLAASLSRLHCFTQAKFTSCRDSCTVFVELPLRETLVFGCNFEKGKKLKLVLLPGMDGTGLLFEPLVKYFQSGSAQEHADQDHSLAVQILPLPTDGAQDYSTLAATVLKQLPNEDFILVAESFSGGIAACLSQHTVPHLKGIIFVATFLSGPKKLIAYLASFLPLRHIAKLPFSSVVYRLLFLGKDATPEQMALFQSALNAAPANVLKLRLKAIAQFEYDGFKSNVPAVYIAATKDRLVPAIKKQEFVQAYSNIAFATIYGPHFILQANPKDSAAAIINAANLLLNNSY